MSDPAETVVDPTPVLPALKTLLAVPRDQVGPMTPGEADDAIVVGLMNPTHPPVTPVELASLLGESFASNVFVNRLAVANAQGETRGYLKAPIMIAPAAAIMMIRLSRDPTQLVMWAHTLFVRSAVLRVPYGFTHLWEDFGWGFPTDQGYATMWDAQKAPDGRNRIDDIDEWNRTILAESHKR